MAWEKLGTANISGAVANTSWKEIGRATLTSTGNTIDSGTFTAKDNIMFLHHIIVTTSQANQKVAFNSDTGNNYARRFSANGGTDSTATNQPNIDTFFGSDTVGDSFSVATVSNVASQEKLCIAEQVGRSTAGAGNAPGRSETVGKWANTSNQITSIQATNSAPGTYGIGSEVVVLGYDNDEADSGTNFWQELADVSATSGSSISSGTFTAKKYLWVQLQMTGSSDGTWRVGNSSVDSGSNYAQRDTSNNASDQTNTSRANIEATYGAPNQLINMFIINKSDKEKLFITEIAGQGTSGAGNAPNRKQSVAKWVNTSDQINIIESQGWGTISSARLKVFGAD